MFIENIGFCPFHWLYHLHHILNIALPLLVDGVGVEGGDDPAGVVAHAFAQGVIGYQAHKCHSHGIDIINRD